MMAQRDLVVSLQLDTRDVQRGTNQTIRNFSRLQGSARSFGNGASRGFGRANRGLLELSRGAEDFAVSFGTGGVAGGFRGAANNISQFASMIHPLAGAVAGLGVAAVSMWLGFNKGADDAIDKTKDFSKALKFSKENIKRFQGEIAFRRLNEEGPRGAAKMSAEQIDSRTEDISFDLRDISDELKANQREAARLLSPQGVTPELLQFNKGAKVSEALGAIGKNTSDVAPRSLQPLLEIEKRNRELIDKRQRLATERRKLLEQRSAVVDQTINELERDINRAYEKRRKADEDERNAALRARSAGRRGSGSFFSLSAPKAQETFNPNSTTAAQRGSREANRIIANSQKEARIQQQQLDALKDIKDQLVEASKQEQNTIIYDSFGGMVA